MPTLRFHSDLYARDAVREAVEAFVEHAEFEHSQQPPYEAVAVVVNDAASEAEVIGEFGNYVLALTVEKNRG